MTLREQLAMAACASMSYIAIDYKNKRNRKVAASNINIKIHTYIILRWKQNPSVKLWKNYKFRFSVYQKHEVALWIHGLKYLQFRKTSIC